MESWNYLVFDPIRAMIATTARYIPILIGALLILILGWIIAKILRELTQQLLKAIKFDNLADKAGVSEVLSTPGIKISPPSHSPAIHRHHLPSLRGFHLTAE